MTTRAGSAVALVALAAGLLTGCATRQAMPGADSSSAPVSASGTTQAAGTPSSRPTARPSALADPGTEPFTPRELGIMVQEVRQSGGGRLRFTMTVRGGAPGCVKDPYARVDAVEHGTVFVTTTYDSSDSQACTTEETRDVETRVPMRPGRQLVVNRDRWKPGPGRSYVLCNRTLGCNPSADRCAPEWTNALLARTELPPERRLHVVVCSGRWLVLEVDAVMSGCQGVDGSTPPPGCEKSAMHRRWFATLDADRSWTVVASLPKATGGPAECAEVLQQRADFPKRLCSRL